MGYYLWQNEAARNVKTNKRMPRHRGLSLDRFVRAVPPDLLERYTERVSEQAVSATPVPSGWQLLNPQALALFLNASENAEVAGVILDDFQRVNDIALDGAAILSRACRKYGLEMNGLAPEGMAMSLFLDHRDAFDFAWSRYLLYGSASRLSVHPMPLGPIRITTVQVSLLEEGVKAYFANQAKGEQCIVRQFEDDGQTVILIKHGTYVHTIPFWKGDEVRVTSLRPALEDVLVYEPDAGVLRVKAGLSKDREEYLRLFALCVGGDERLADAAVQGEVFSLEPIQNGSFDFSGEGPITKVRLRRVRMIIYGVTDLVADFRSPDVLRSFERDIPGFGVSSGLVTMARLCFHVHYPDERPTTVTFTIEPPATTDLAERRHADEIFRYLTRQGIRLR